MISLGGNIVLEGFDGLPPAELLIVKKLIGSYVREVCDELKDRCTGTKISLIGAEEEQYTIKVDIECDDTPITAEDSASNIFVAIDKAAKKTMKKIGIEN